MLVIPGHIGKDTCDGVTRRELLRVGGSALIGLSLANILGVERARAEGKKKDAMGVAGFGKAKNVILCYLQGGPSHLDLWDPKDNVPANVKSAFKAINTKTSGVLFTEVLPKAKSLDAAELREIALKLDLPNGALANGSGIKFTNNDWPPNPKDAGQNLRASIGVWQWQKSGNNQVFPKNLATHDPIMVPLPEWSKR